MINYVDIIYGLAWGDEGKGKIANILAHEYDYVCRWNGGPNAGHTVYINGKKYKTHIIPSGIFAGKKCIIGPGCVINIDKMREELRVLSGAGFDINLIKVSPNAHIITDDHIEYDKQNLTHLGTTGQGIAPCYADKMLRKGKRAKDVLESNWLWDGKLSGKILCEGAQSVWLDIDHGDYPYVTSSTTMPYGACSLGFSPKAIGRIIGVGKIYDTKSGTDPLFPTSLWEDEDLNRLIQYGEEYGSTTGRKRLVNWLNLDKMIQAICLSGCTEVIINKCDVLEKLGKFKLTYQNKLIEFNNMHAMKEFIADTISCGMNGNDLANNDVYEVTFSASKEVLI
jgi:adenylosuccinate synthase